MTVAVPLWPSQVAVSVAVPAATPVTRPFAEIVATAGALLAQVPTRPANGLPAESRGVALSCTVAPMRMVAAAGLTVTAATGTTDTVTVAVPLCPSLVAVSVAAPAAIAATRPLAETVATAGALLAHATARPDNGVPFASFRVAVS